MFFLAMLGKNKQKHPRKNKKGVHGMSTYRKLVRDGVPEQLEKAGNTFEVETLNQDRYIMELRKKLHEEVGEYEEAGNPEEAQQTLADILEVIHVLADVHDTTMEEIENLRMERRDKYGSYHEKQFLIHVNKDK
jgi:predicted house-cleaning noncanonical NTP pyrophosphatase (MazG superfamily)